MPRYRGSPIEASHASGSRDIVANTEVAEVQLASMDSRVVAEEFSPSGDNATTE